MQLRIFLFFLIVSCFEPFCFSQSNAHDFYLSALAKDSAKDYEGALNDLNKALISYSGNDTLHVLRAKVEIESNQIKEAYTEVNGVIKHNHSYFEAYMLRGILKAKAGNYEGAISDFNKCLKLNPKVAKVFYNRGLAHAYLDEIKQGIADFTSATDLEPNYANAWFQRGFWKELSGDLQGSLSDLNRAKELNPNDKELYVSLAVTTFKLNKKSEACNYLNEAKNRGSSSAEELIGIMCK